MAKAQKPYGGVYENYDFEKVYGPREWVEYPKAIPTGTTQFDKSFKIANNKAEEDDIRAKFNQQIEDSLPAEQHAYVADPEKEILISRARELKIPLNEKWSKSKLQGLISQAEADVDALPVEIEPSKEQIKDAKLSLLGHSHISQDEENEDVHSKLLNEAKSLGIKERNMHLWGVPRLKAAIAEEKAKV